MKRELLLLAIERLEREGQPLAANMLRGLL